MDRDLDAIRGKLEAKGVDDACPACKSVAGWHIGLPDTGAITFLVTLNRDSGHTGSLHVLPVICVHCGFVRLHSPKHLMDD